MCSYSLLCLVLFCEIVSSRDFYAGMFRTNDFLVAQDRVYKEKVPYRSTQAKYGRYFKCPITYFRVVDRLGVGGGTRVKITRGGLKHRFLTLLLTSSYNLPISVNIYVGCENKKKTVLTTARKTTTISTTSANSATTATSATGNETSTSPAGEDSTTITGGVETTGPGGDESTTPGGDTTTTPGGDTTTTPGGDTTTTPGGDTTTTPGGDTTTTPDGDTTTTPQPK